MNKIDVREEKSKMEDVAKFEGSKEIVVCGP